MTACIVNPFDNLPSEGNRPQRYWLMARAFAAAGWRVVYWASDFSHATKRKRAIDGRRPDASARAIDRAIETVLVPTIHYSRNICPARIRSHLVLARDFGAMARARISAGGRPDIVVSSTPPLGLCAAALDVARSCGARFVCDIQDAWPETFGRLLPRGFKWLGGLLFAGMRRTARRIYREADVVTGVCRRYAALSGRDDFYLAHHGIEEGEGRRRGTERGAQGLRLVYAGNLGAGYDLGTVVEAVARRVGLTLDIAGLGPREGELREQVTRRGLASRVRFHGYLGDEALRALMASCDVGVVPMRDDSWVGLPYKLGDYLCAGLQVVSSLHGECGELLVRTGFGRTYEWGSPGSLLDALDGLKPTEVALPEELRAEVIYPRYVQRVVML